MKKNIIVFLTGLFLIHPLFAQQAIITETVQTFKTYPFSDPDPVADPSDLFYPYFRFDGFAAKGMDKDWKVVSLENDYIKLKLYPEIGGKIWGAVDKTSGKEFIYNNHVVKFRDKCHTDLPPSVFCYRSQEGFLYQPSHTICL